MSCEYCGTPVYHYEGRWLHAVKGDYDHQPTPEGSLPAPRRKPITAAKEALRLCRKLYPWRADRARQTAALDDILNLKRKFPMPLSTGLAEAMLR